VLKSVDKNAYGWVTMAQAEWVLEAFANGLHRDTSADFGLVRQDTLEFNIEVAALQGADTLTDAELVHAAWRALDAWAAAAAHPDSEALVLVDVQLAATAASRYAYRAIGVVGKANPGNTYPYCAATGNEYYWWFFGNCNGGAPLYGLNGAPQRIEWTLNNSVCRRTQCPYPQAFLSDVASSTLFGSDAPFDSDYLNPSDPTPGDYIRDYRLYASFGGVHECLSPSDIDFYVGGVYDLVQIKKPAGRLVLTYDMGWDGTLCNCNEPHPDRWHNVTYFHTRCREITYPFN
jgi:hypothetical protein